MIQIFALYCLKLRLRKLASPRENRSVILDFTAKTRT